MPITDDKPRGKYPNLWIGWLIVVIGGFFLIEIPALANDSGGDTFTEQVQYLAGYGWWAVVLIGGALVALFTWLMPHFFGLDSRVWKWMKWREENKDAEGQPDSSPDGPYQGSEQEEP